MSVGFVEFSVCVFRWTCVTHVMEITDTTHSLLLIPEELMQQDTLRKTLYHNNYARIR